MTLQASTIRFVELAPMRCVAVYSRAGKVVWAVPSRTLGFMLPRGTRLHPRTLAGGFHSNGKLDDRPRSLAGDHWFASKTAAEVVEHSVVDGDGVITLLWLPEPAIVPAQLAVANMNNEATHL
jgi:hypothetical protein